MLVCAHLPEGVTDVGFYSSVRADGLLQAPRALGGPGRQATSAADERATHLRGGHPGTKTGNMRSVTSSSSAEDAFLSPA